jgi:hypothetical protein
MHGVDGCGEWEAWTLIHSMMEKSKEVIMFVISNQDKSRLAVHRFVAGGEVLKKLRWEELELRVLEFG